MERIPQLVALRVAFKAFLTGTSTPAPGKAIAMTISKNGAGLGNLNVGPVNATEIGSGLYYVDLSTVDINTLGPLIVHGVEGTIDNVDVFYNVVDANTAGFNSVWDAVRADHTIAGTFGGDSIDEATLILDIRNDLDANSNIAGLTYTEPNQVDVNVLSWLSSPAPAMTGDAYGALTGLRSEPGQVVAPVSASILDKIDFVYKAWRNKSSQTNGLYALFNSDGVTIDQKATVTFDGVTFVRNAIGVGP